MVQRGILQHTMQHVPMLSKPGSITAGTCIENQGVFLYIARDNMVAGEKHMGEQGFIDWNCRGKYKWEEAVAIVTEKG